MPNRTAAAPICSPSRWWRACRSAPARLADTYARTDANPDTNCGARNRHHVAVAGGARPTGGGACLEQVNSAEGAFTSYIDASLNWDGPAPKQMLLIIGGTNGDQAARSD